MSYSIFHIDDDIQTLDVYCDAFQDSDDKSTTNKIRSFTTCSELDEALQAHPHVDAFIIDIYLDGKNEAGLSIVEKCRQIYPKAIILVSSATRSPHTIYKSLENGADDFISKDIEPKTLKKIIEDKIFIRSILQKRSLNAATFCGNFMSQVNQRSLDIISSAVNCVHIFGATGTGKEVVADLFESNLPSGTPFIRVNCGALTPSLMLSELFGHVRGAFTGATSDKRGLIQAADNGWIFLDEIATLPNEAQIALLRVIESQKVRCVGASRDIPINVRVISATNEKITDLVSHGTFRNDLWQRLRETEISIPTLSERKNEIPDLVHHFCKTMRGGPYVLAPGVLQILMAFEWRDGNIRELRNCLRSMTEKSSNKILTPNCLPIHIWKSTLGDHSVKNGPIQNDESPEQKGFFLSWTGEERPNFQKLCTALLLEMIQSEFRKHGQLSLRSLAQLCGIPKSSLTAKVNRIVDLGLTTKAELERMLSCKGAPHH